MANWIKNHSGDNMILRLLRFIEALFSIPSAYFGDWADSIDTELHERLRESMGGILANKKPKIVVLCGSSRFVDIMAVCEWLIERDELAITMGLNLLPSWYPDCPSDHLAEHEGCADEMDKLHLRKIDLADEIFIVNKNDYVGDSTMAEIKYAQKHKIPVRWYTQDPVGVAVEKIIKRFLDAKAD